MRRSRTPRTQAFRLVVAAVAIGVPIAGCNGILGIHAALDEEWDGGSLGDGGTAVSQMTMGASNSTSSSRSVSGSGAQPPDAGSVAHWANWPMPNPPSIEPPLPNQQNYDTTNAAVVIDNITHLQWEANSDGNLYTYADAVAHCSGLQLGATGGGWRLPSRIELLSILDNTQQPRISAAFHMPANDGGPITFWASSLLAGDNSLAWVVDFGTSTQLVIAAQAQPSASMPLVVKYYARCVRGP